MAKRREVDGKFYRLRKGKWVQIPPEWVGRVSNKQTISKRKKLATLKRSPKYRKWALARKNRRLAED